MLPYVGLHQRDHCAVHEQRVWVVHLDIVDSVDIVDVDFVDRVYYVKYCLYLAYTPPAVESGISPSHRDTPGDRRTLEIIC